MRQPIFSLALAFSALTVALQPPVLLAAANYTISPNPGKDLAMMTGESANLTCTGDNSTDWTIWLGPRRTPIALPIPDGGPRARPRIYATYSSVSVPNIAYLILGNLTKADSGPYGCFSIWNRQPYIYKVPSNQFNLHVFHPTQLTGTRHFTVKAGRPQTLECIVTSDADVHLEITWFYQGRDLSTVHLSKYRINTSPPRAITHTSGLVRTVTRLIFPRVEKEDEGEYSCSVKSTNAYLANEEEFQVYLKVVSKPRFPANTPGTIWIDEETVKAGVPILVNLTCSVTADPLAALSWFQGHWHYMHLSKVLKNGLLPSSMGNVTTKITAKITNKPNTSSLTLRFPSIDDFKSLQVLHGYFPHKRPNPKAEFTCCAKNDWGQSEMVYQLKLGHRPAEPVILSLNYTDDGHVWLQLKESDEQAGPPVDAYRLDVGPEKGHIFDASTNGNQTYSIKMNLSPGEHKVTLVAHNALGWTQNSSRTHLLTVNKPESVQASLEVDQNSSPSFPRLSWAAILVILLTRITLV